MFGLRSVNHWQQDLGHSPINIRKLTLSLNHTYLSGITYQPSAWAPIHIQRHASLLTRCSLKWSTVRATRSCSRCAGNLGKRTPRSGDGLTEDRIAPLSVVEQVSKPAEEWRRNCSRRMQLAIAINVPVLPTPAEQCTSTGAGDWPGACTFSCALASASWMSSRRGSTSSGVPRSDQSTHSKCLIWDRVSNDESWEDVPSWSEPGPKTRLRVLIR